MFNAKSITNKWTHKIQEYNGADVVCKDLEEIIGSSFNVTAARLVASNARVIDKLFSKGDSVSIFFEVDNELSTMGENVVSNAWVVLITIYLPTKHLIVIRSYILNDVSTFANIRATGNVEHETNYEIVEVDMDAITIDSLIEGNGCRDINFIDEKYQVRFTVNTI